MLDLNPIDVLKQRKVKTLPPHFSKVTVSDTELFEGDIQSWIENKLKGRYCVLRSPSIDKDGKLKSATFVAFEEQKELTYFMLACPHLRRN
jgi:hypothetical protein